MNYYFIYLGSILLSIFGGISLFNKYRNPSGFFFLLFSVASSIWCMLYFLFLGGNLGQEITLILSRLAFAVSLLGMYTFLLFIVFFDYRKKQIFIKKVVYILIFYFIFFCFSILSDNIIHSLYIGKDGVYRENFGILYPIYVIFYLAFIPLILFITKRQLKKQNYINKLRLKYILYGVVIFISSGLVLQVILPQFGIWIFEKEIVFFFIFFILSVVYTSNRYYFNNIGYGIGNFLIGTISILTSIIIINFLKILYIDLDGFSYWGKNIGNYNPFDIALGIILFLTINRFISSKFLGNNQRIELKNKTQKLEQEISYINNLDELNIFLKNEIQKIFKTNYSEIILYKKITKNNELKKFFENNNSFFINDIVFIEENKKKFNKIKILSEIPKNAFLIFPIFGKIEKNIGFFYLGTKSFGDFYNSYEIETIKGFIFFLEYHLKYIETYEKLKDLSINLDKKVDEKTIEYNNLINKQKEFIALISHEIRSPISGAIFQADSIIDDLNNGKLDNKKLKSELEILNSLLIKTGELSSKLFTVAYYDTNSISLYKEKIKVSNLLQSEYEIYSHINENIEFIDKIDKNMGFIEIDKIQFQQVIENIITNAIKFIDKKAGIISIESFIKSGFLYINIEDNGRGFKGIKIENIFDKYSVGSGNSAGLGMGLYLCKKIVEMHSGEIKAGISKKLSGAKFSIKIPVK